MMLLQGKPSSRDHAGRLMVDKLERLLRSATDLDLQLLEELPDLFLAKQLADNVRDQAKEMLWADSLAWLIQATWDLPATRLTQGLRQEWRDQSLGSWAADLAGSQ